MLNFNIVWPDHGKPFQIDIHNNATVKQLKYKICSMIQHDHQELDLTQDQRSLDDNQQVGSIHTKSNTLHCRKKKGHNFQHDNSGPSALNKGSLSGPRPAAPIISNPVSINQSSQLENQYTLTPSTLKVEIVTTQPPNSNELKVKAKVSPKDVVQHQIARSLNPEIVPPSTVKHYQQNNISLTNGKYLNSYKQAEEDQDINIFENSTPSKRNLQNKEPKSSLQNTLASKSAFIKPAPSACLAIFPSSSHQPFTLAKDAQPSKVPIAMPLHTKPMDFSVYSKSEFLPLKMNDPPEHLRISSTLSSIQFQTANFSLQIPSTGQSFQSATGSQNASNTVKQSVSNLQQPMIIQKPTSLMQVKTLEPQEYNSIKFTTLPQQTPSSMGQPKIEQGGQPATIISIAQNQSTWVVNKQAQSEINFVQSKAPVEIQKRTVGENDEQQTAGSSIMTGNAPTSNQQNQQATTKSHEIWDKSIEETVWETCKVVCTYCNLKITGPTLTLICRCPYHLDCLSNIVEETLKRGQAVSRCVKGHNNGKINVNYLKGGLLSDQDDYRIECWKPKCYMELREGTIRWFFVQQLKQLINNSADLLPQEAIRIYKEYS